MNQLDSHLADPSHEYIEEVGQLPRGMMPPIDDPVKLSFTIRDDHLHLLDSIKGELQVRFNTTIQVEKTSYAADKGSVRWVELQGRDEMLTKCAKSYVEALCSPEHEQRLEYPPQLHEEITAKKDGVEHKYGYKAVVKLQEKAAIIVSGQIDEVLMVISYFEHEINQWYLQLQDSGYSKDPRGQMTNVEQHERWQPNLIQFDDVESTRIKVSSAGGEMHMNSRTLPTERYGSSAATNAQEEKQDAMSQQSLPRLVLRRNNDKDFVQGNEDVTPSKPYSHNVLPGRQHESTERHWMVPNSKHLSTPPHSSVDLKRQRTDGIMADLVTDSSVESSNNNSCVGSYGHSSTGSSTQSNRHSSSGSSSSFTASTSVEYAQSAAQRLGYSVHEVSQALEDLPPDWKTSDLISTLSRRRKHLKTNVPPPGISSQCNPRNRKTFMVPDRPTSPFSDPGDSIFSSRQSVQHDKQPSSSHPLPLTSLSHNPSAGSASRETAAATSRYTNNQSLSTARKTETLRRRQMELLRSLGSQPVGRPPDVNIFEPTTSTISSISRKPNISEIVEADDVMVLNDEQDMEFAAALEGVEQMDVDHSQEDIQYVDTTFPGDNKSPDILLISPPKKMEPELVIIDEDESNMHHFNTKQNVFQKISLAPTFTVPPQMHRKYPDGTSRTFGSFSAIQKQDDSRTKHYTGSNQFKKMDYAGPGEIGKETDEPDSLSEPSSPSDKMSDVLGTYEMRTAQHEQKVQTLPAIPPMSFPHLKLDRKQLSEIEDTALEDSTDDPEDQVHIIKQEKSPEEPEVKELGVMELIQNFQADFESQKDKFEREVREKTVNETLNMVSEQNEILQRQIKERQKAEPIGKESVTGDDVDEKLRAERKKLNEKQKKVMQKMGQQLEDFKEKVLKESEEKLQERYSNMIQEQRDELQQQQTQEHQRLLQEQQKKFQIELQRMQRNMQDEMRKQQEMMQETMQRQMQQQQQQQNPPVVALEEDAIVIKPSKKGTPSPFRPIAIDGSNVAMLHGKRRNEFSCRGIALCVQYFQSRGIEDITVFVPRWRQHKGSDPKILDSLESKGILSYTPGRKLRGQYVNSYDDRFVIRLAAENGGVIVSNDNFRDLMQESDEWKHVIETRLLMFTFAGDKFMVPDDPFGRHGPTLDQLLTKPKAEINSKKLQPAATNTRQQKEPAGLSEYQLEQLVFNIGMEWQTFGTYLRFSHSEITKISHEHPHNTDGAIMHMLKTWNARQRNKTTNFFDVLSEALRHAGRGDLGELVLTWKVERQRNKEGGNRPGHTGPGVWRQGEPHPQPGGTRDPGQQPGVDTFQQVYQAGARSKSHAPTTQSKPPEVRVIVKTLPQYKSLIEMFPDKASQIEKMLKESPEIDENALIDKLLS